MKAGTAAAGAGRHLGPQASSPPQDCSKGGPPGGGAGSAGALADAGPGALCVTVHRGGAGMTEKELSKERSGGGGWVQ